MDLNNLSYEKAMLQLENILEELEGDSLTLDESLNKFKEGAELYKYCIQLLNKAEGEIKILLKDDEGSLSEVDFQMED